MADETAIALIEPDPFLAEGKRMADYIPIGRYQAAGLSGYDLAAGDIESTGEGDIDVGRFSEMLAVARPFLGTESKPNATAFVQVVRSNGNTVKVLNRLGKGMREYYSGDVDSSLVSQEHGRLSQDAWAKTNGDYNDGRIFHEAVGESGERSTGGQMKDAWTDWILQTVKETRVEKTQLIETFGDNYLYVFGERPRTLSFQGILLNTADYNWRAEFWENWDFYFRATKLVQLDARMYISWDDVLVEGYPISANAHESAESPNAMVFSFNFYVTSYTSLAAKNGFENEKRRRQATMRSGVNAYAGSGKRVINDYWNKWSILDMLGSKGTTMAARKATEALYASSLGASDTQRVMDLDHPDGPQMVDVPKFFNDPATGLPDPNQPNPDYQMSVEGRVMNSLLNPLTSASIQMVGNAVIKGGLGYLNSMAALESFMHASALEGAKILNEALFKTTMQGLVEHQAAGEMAGPLQVLKPGELNHLSNQVNESIKRWGSAGWGDGQASKHGSWDGVDMSNAGSVMATALSLGSLDQIAAGMAYGMSYKAGKSGQDVYQSAKKAEERKAEMLSGYKMIKGDAMPAGTMLVGVNLKDQMAEAVSASGGVTWDLEDETNEGPQSGGGAFDTSI